MKLVIDGQLVPEPPIKVRLRPDHDEQSGITMEAYVGGTWQPICTLREDGVLGLWDVRNYGLVSAGFQMIGTHSSHRSNGPIKTCVQ